VKSFATVLHLSPHDVLTMLASDVNLQHLCGITTLQDFAEVQDVLENEEQEAAINNALDAGCEEEVIAHLKLKNGVDDTQVVGYTR